jgi:hydrogenase/urease accessory protein HupE
LAGLLSTLSGAAHAHLVAARFGEFYSGLLHPLTALDHAVPWLAIGLLAGWQGARAGRWMLLIFPGAVLVGTLLAASGVSSGAAPMINLASFVVLGGLLALAAPLPLSLVLAFGVLFGLSHGDVNGLAAPAGGNTPLFALGVAAASYVVVALTAAATVAFISHAGWQRIALQAVGSWIAAIGIMMTGLALSPALTVT